MIRAIAKKRLGRKNSSFGNYQKVLRKSRSLKKEAIIFIAPTSSWCFLKMTYTYNIFSNRTTLSKKFKNFSRHSLSLRRASECYHQVQRRRNRMRYTEENLSCLTFRKRQFTSNSSAEALFDDCNLLKRVGKRFL